MEFLKQFIDYGIFGILGVMSLLALTYTLERLFFYRKIDIAQYKDFDSLETELTSNLTALSIISSNAPYIGLLGTVLGIMVTFYDMGTLGHIQTDTILIGLSLALKATALGLVVAIPTLMSYSACLRRCDVISAKWKSLHAT
ncbi:MAG: TonB-system energizer ExbB [Sulfurospirillaceae bacterium]|nr:TonB-system energizer ExbB [Sulfurospirillaceae bacterium]